MKGKEITEGKLGSIMMTPAIVLIIATAVIPIIYVFYLSTRDIRGIMDMGYIGLENYRTIIETGRLQSALVATFLFGFGTIAFQLVAAMIVALALNVEFKGRNLVRSLILIPWAIPTALVGVMWSRFLASTDGYFNATLRLLGLVEGEVNWFLSRGTAIMMVILVDSWKFTAIFVMIFLAGLQAIPTTFYEAALVDGANRLQRFFRLTLPIMKPVILVALIMRTIFVFHAFDLIFILTGGGPGDATRVLSYYTYQETFSFLRHGRGSAVAFILFLLTGLVTLIYIKILGTKKQV